MSDTKTKPITDPKRLRPFGQNVELCADIKGLTLEVVAKEANIPLSLLTSFLHGRGVLTPEVVERLASVFGLSKLQLIGTNGPLQTRTQIFKGLFDLEKEIEVPHEDFDRSLVRGGKSFQWPIGVRKGDDDDDAEEAAEESSDESETNTTAPEAEQSECSEPSTEPVDTPPAPLPLGVSAIDDTVTWRSATRALCDGRSFDLTDMRLRKLLGTRLLSARGSVILSEFGNRMQPKRSSSWLHNLKRGAIALSRSDLEQAVTICNVPLSSLLTGQGLEEAILKKRR